MGLIMRLSVILLSLLLGLQALSAEEGMTTTESARQQYTQTVRCRPRMCRRALRHQRGNSCVAIPAAQRASDASDQVVAKIDEQPAQVLVEAVIVQVRLNKDNMDSGVNLALLDGVNKTPVAIGGGAATDGVKLGLVGGNVAGFTRALQDFGEIKVLAAPRMLVLNKQRAEIHLGDRLGWLTTTVNETSTTQTVNFINIGTQLRLRPFVLSDGMIRLEVNAEHTTGRLDELGVPQTTTNQVTANVTIPDGVTIVMGGPISTEATQGREGPSFMSWIPYLGSLLGNTPDVATKEQFIVLLTAHIWKR
jgi:general secretion pathway protein D